MTPGGRAATTARRPPKQAIALREEQVVSLRLRQHSFTAIARVVGLSRQNCQKAFVRALHRRTAVDIQTHHRTELAELAAEAKAAWEMVDTKEQPKTKAAGLAILNRIHIRRAHLLGLDAPAKFDVRAVYGGTDEMTQERRDTERTWLAMSREERALIYDTYDAARARLDGPIETTATVTLGSDNPPSGHGRPDQTATDHISAWTA
jgi:hypothetical protein